MAEKDSIGGIIPSVLLGDKLQELAPNKDCWGPTQKVSTIEQLSAVFSLNPKIKPMFVEIFYNKPGETTSVRPKAATILTQEEDCEHILPWGIRAWVVKVYRIEVVDGQTKGHLVAEATCDVDRPTLSATATTRRGVGETLLLIGGSGMSTVTRRGRKSPRMSDINMGSHH